MLPEARCVHTTNEQIVATSNENNFWHCNSSDNFTKQLFYVYNSFNNNNVEQS